MICIISDNNKNRASDYTLTNLVDNRTVFLNDAGKCNFVIINKSAYRFNKVKFDYLPSKIYGMRIVDDIQSEYLRHSTNSSIGFFVVSSLEAFLWISNREPRPVLHLEDAVDEVPIQCVPHLDIPYTFCNPNNLHRDLMGLSVLHVYSSIDRRFFNPEDIRGVFHPWKRSSVYSFSRYKKALIYYRDYIDEIGATSDPIYKSINRIAQCMYFDQSIVTNYPGRIRQCLLDDLKITPLEGAFYEISGSTRAAYDRHLSNQQLKRQLIEFLRRFEHIRS